MAVHGCTGQCKTVQGSGAGRCRAVQGSAGQWHSTAVQQHMTVQYRAEQYTAASFHGGLTVPRTALTAESQVHRADSLGSAGAHDGGTQWPALWPMVHTADAQAHEAESIGVRGAHVGGTQRSWK